MLEQLDLLHRRQYRDLYDRVRASKTQAQAQSGAPAGWSLQTPRAAYALGDQRSIDAWNQRIDALDDAEFLRWLALSHKPIIDRPIDIPEHDDLLALEATKHRIEAICASRDAKKQKALQHALVPVSRGRRPRALDESALERARVDRAALTREIQKLQGSFTGAVTYQSDIRDIIDRELSGCPESERKKLAEQLSSARFGRLLVPPSAAASRIAARKSRLPPDRVRRGTAPRLPKQRTPCRIVASGNLEAIDHAAEKAAAAHVGLDSTSALSVGISPSHFTRRISGSGGPMVLVAGSGT